MVRVVKVGNSFIGVNEEDCVDGFWEGAKSFVFDGCAVIVALNIEDAEEMCSGVIEWV